VKTVVKPCTPEKDETTLKEGVTLGGTVFAADLGGSSKYSSGIHKKFILSCPLEDR
jgi:hypothetical protein